MGKEILKLCYMYYKTEQMSTRVNVVESRGSPWTRDYGTGRGNRGGEETFSSTLLDSVTGT